MQTSRWLLAAALALGATQGLADITPVTVPDIPFRSASLSVMGADGEMTYDPKTLEALGTFQMVTVTPWRDQAATFVGVRLRDVLAAHGLDTAPAIRVTAENDYSVVIEQSTWTENDVLIATRVDGTAHTRRERGPLQFVFEMSENSALGTTEFETNWVWMAAKIEPTQ